MAVSYIRISVAETRKLEILQSKIQKEKNKINIYNPRSMRAIQFTKVCLRFIKSISGFQMEIRT